MPRGLFRKITPRSETLRTHWALKPFGRFFGDPRLWSLQRRTVTPAFGAALAICFVPLPIHIPLAAITAIFCRIHIPTIMLTLMLMNPLTFLPLFLLAYKVGAIVTGAPPSNFHFEMSWDWVQNGLGANWKPFLVGCGLTGALFGLVGWGVLDLLWRANVRKRYRERAGSTSD
ncbi:MAG TPA: DUF2062 domain-containing protein [Steroidobacteraceae bacterium]|nr:DUF2062 domain-containing protein [Steroidobacteraceae bacterium]